jgi:hypothetical protein
MPLEEDAVMQALGLLTPGVSPGAQSLLSSQVQGGGLGERYIGGARSYFDPRSGLPLGATDDPRSPMGFTIADPNLRSMYSNEMGGTARAVAQNEYMDAFERDKLKNTLAIMQASDKLDPELQFAVMQRLGVNVPGYDQGGGGMGGGPGAGYLGARQTGTGPTGDPIITPMFAEGSPTGGYMSRRLREELAKLKFENELKAPTTAADIRLKEQQGQAAVETAGANRGYKEALQSGPANQYKIGLLNAIDNITAKYKDAAGGPGIPGNPVAAGNLKRAMDVLMAELERAGGAGGISTPGAAPTAGAPPGSDVGPQSQVEQNPWWDRAMPSNQNFQPNMAKVAELQRQLTYMQQFAPNDTNMIQSLMLKLQNELTPQISTPAPAQVGQPGQIKVRKN